MGQRLLPFLLGLCVALVLAPAALAGGSGFGLRSVEISATERPTPEQEAKHERGAPDVQAGSHPYALTTSFSLNESDEIRPETFVPFGEGPRDGRVELPPGFVGNPNAVPKCAYAQFSEEKCPNDTAIGLATTDWGADTGYVSGPTQAYVDREEYYTNALYNIEPQGGVAAEFGFWGHHNDAVLLEASVRTGSDYGITVTGRIPQAIVLQGATITTWGVPADPSHNRVRGTCLGQAESGRLEAEEGEPHDEERSVREEQEEAGVPPSELAPAECPVSIPVEPFLTNPTSCGESRAATLSVDSWEAPGVFDSETATLPPLEGCEKLNFAPTLAVTPDGAAGSTPTGLNVEVHVPQESTTNPEGLGEADVKDTTVTLPAGVQLSPAAADGLQACSLSQIGLHTAEKPSCPDASKVANVKIKTPLLEHELQGAVYLAAPQNFAGIPENPFSSLIALYLVAEEPETAVLVKVAGRVEPNPVTGQLTSTFENTPQLPYESLKLEFYGTDRAPLATPALCGTYTTTSSFTPWSAPESGSPATPSSSFQIASGPNGGACSDPLPFSPTLQSGSTNISAGSFSPLTTTLSREDGQQNIQQVTLHYPSGLSGILSGVKLCGEAEANAGTCSSESEIGETIVSVGLGNDPFTVTGGRVYLTGPYEGAPFGLSIVNPAKAGPFDLQEGRPVIVRAKVEVDPHTAALTVTTNTAAQGHAIPSIIEGIPLQIKHVNVDITRPGFTFNPTDCNPTQITGTIASAEGAASTVSIPFQVTNCASLKFQPGFSVSTQSRTSKADGASLTAKVTYPYGPQGTYANVAKVKVELPKALPSRLTTLQKACTAAQFDANPAGCPAASVIGHAIVHTPLLPVPLEGPAYFVSNGGEAFPNLIMVLQGYGVTINLVGDTFISKAGITSTTFKTVPDQPFSSFELTLPEGPYSALTATGDLCTQQLTMPNEFIGQNGTELRQDTAITVGGCPNAVRVVSKSVKGNTATIRVSVPSAGKLVATGNGLSKASKTAGGATTLTVKLSLTKGKAAFLNKHRNRRLKAKIDLTFTPKKGKRLEGSTTVLIG